MIIETLDHLKTEGLNIKPEAIIFIPNDHKAQEMRKEAVHTEPLSLVYVPDHFKTQEMCIKAVVHKPYMLGYVPDHFKTQEICNKALREGYFSLQRRQRSRYICGMVMMNLSSSMMVIKNARPKKN